VGYDLYHQTNHWIGKPMSHLQLHPIAKGHWHSIGIDFITDLPPLDNGPHCIVMFVNHIAKRAREVPERKQSMHQPLHEYSSTTL
jgi:hypothetical protein